MRYIWLIPLLPGLGAAINGLVGIRSFSRKTAGLVACATMTAALALALVAFWQLLGLPADARAYDVIVASWIPTIPLATHDGFGNFQVPWGFRLDPLSGMMLLVVTGIGTLIHVYSTAYMADEPRGGVARFFCYLNLFCFFMLMLVLGNNFLVMFVGWEGVGLCSYLLIGYWYEKKSASDAGKKAFITNRIGDWGFILGVFLIYYTFGTLDFRAVQNAAAAMPIETGHFGVLSFICLFLFVGATGKSAQIPLYVWLPDAMEGPTPVSALIHAATMVTAGVYMLGRNAVLFTHAPEVMTIVAIVGVLTALMAASIGLVQYDIKRVLAYSTVSQLGYMFTAMGVGAFSAGAFHLMTHAFFKALLFLGSGSVIHAMAGEQDMRRMGGAEEIPAGHLRDDDDRHAGDCRHSAVRRVLQQGRDPLPRVPGEQDHLGPGGRHGADDRVLHVPPDGDDLLRRVSRPGVGDATAARTWPPPQRTARRIRPIPTRTARRTRRTTKSATGPPNRTTHRGRPSCGTTPTMRMAATVTDRGTDRTNRRSR